MKLSKIRTVIVQELAQRQRLRELILERWEFSPDTKDRVRAGDLGDELAEAVGRAVPAAWPFRRQVQEAMQLLGLGPRVRNSITVYTHTRRRKDAPR